MVIWILDSSRLALSLILERTEGPGLTALLHDRAAFNSVIEGPWCHGAKSPRAVGHGATTSS
jgi:hypothetical protein